MGLPPWIPVGTEVQNKQKLRNTQGKLPRRFPDKKKKIEMRRLSIFSREALPFTQKKTTWVYPRLSQCHITHTIFTYIWLIFYGTCSVGKYFIHGSYGVVLMNIWKLLEDRFPFF